MRIAICSAKQINGDIYTNLRTMEDMVYKAHESQADIIVFGEAFLQGFDGISFENYEADLALSLTDLDDPIFRVKMMAVGYDLAIGFGYYERSKGNIYSSYLVIDKDGEILTNYRRMSEGWKEKKASDKYQEGKSLEVFEFMNTKMIVGICGDFWSDDLLNHLSTFEYDLVLWPNFNNYTPQQWMNQELGSYRDQCQKIGREVIWINSINPDPQMPAYGGNFYVIDGKFVVNHPMELAGISIIDR